ncbi:MAG: hypothetical protein LBV33_06605 [Lachnospiraceae bacterium]|jgi:7,8-dihydropterin-6-yl-methyl-4-(beta-D-ribofuranosyl)aminobenzene 5'-phosphate synthase|nr:hypothetical protein [Lachnospiraceae bacterium]
MKKITKQKMILLIAGLLLVLLVMHPQIVLLDGDHTIDSELALFIVPDIEKCYSNANDGLYMKDGKDDFSHEQNLMIFDNRNVLIMGCGHAGVVNILEKAVAYKPEVCVGGYHLWNAINKKSASDELLEDIATELAKYSINYYTCHCTGQKAYDYLSRQLPNMSYLSCGDSVEI